MLRVEVAWRPLGESQGDIKCLVIKSPSINGAAAAVAGPPISVCVGGAAGCAPFVGGVAGGFGTFAGGLMGGIMGAGGLINEGVGNTGKNGWMSRLILEPPFVVSVGSVVGAGSTTGGGCKVASGESTGLKQLLHTVRSGL